MPIKRRYATVVMLVFVGGLIALPDSPCQAQMFGQQPMGAQGMLRGNERFLRGNRSRRDFVGSDRVEQSSFVGAQQALATGRVRTAVEGVRLEAGSQRRNRPIPSQPARGMYYPRLEIAFESAAPRSDESILRDSTTSDRLRERIQRVGGSQVQLLLNGSQAILQGSVQDARTAELLLQMLEFEPGIDEVQNMLELDNIPNGRRNF